MRLTIFPDRRILGKHFSSQCSINQTGMNSEDGDTTLIPLDTEMQAQQVHRRFARRVARQMAYVRVAQRAADIDYLNLVIPSLDGTLVEDRADDEERPHSIRLQDVGKLGGGNGRRWRCCMAYGGGADYDIYFST